EIMSSKAICNRINNIPVFNDSSIMNMFIEYMVGHGRSLEALGEAVVDKDMTKPIFRIILAHKSVNKDQTIFELDGQKINVDDVIQFGLVRFESYDHNRVVGYLLCPYIWLWIMAHAYHENVNDPFLRSWDCSYYNEVLSESGEPSIPPGCQYWQHFVAQFKSNIYNYDQRIDLSVIHNGATHNFGQVFISNRQLTLSKSIERVNTKSKDSFCSIYMAETKTITNGDTSVQIIEGTKHFSKGFEEEYNKATSSGDIFIFYTSASCQNLELQPMSAIVNKECWKEYFGPFSGRCYNYAMGPPDINKATFTQLTGFEKIAKKRARIIMEERVRVEFFDINYCERRTKIPRQYIEPFFQKSKAFYHD
ncbi:1261_t:CDS:2, partial [Funneliformis mosseae]